jgi:threonine/homoserine/homoserine lactone efflux protein
MIVEVFLITFIISYLGSIPPGVANVSVMQMGMKNHKRAAIFFSLSACLVEFLYAGLTVKFQLFLQASTRLESIFHLITAAALIAVGILSMRSKSTTSDVHGQEIAKGRDGFKKGIVLGFLNPMTIPFWLMVTAYIQNHQIIPLDGAAFWTYLTGISLGTFALLMTVLWLGNKFKRISDNQLLVHKVPGILLIILGIYTLIAWYF